ncbi:unnamed protein product [Diatraea saccharalis]|uniref:Uncharacterized protein n=1 Tax=Diatraea saccharalis TaxID=40085 RepID=A0A9N9QTG8_9NEOP|nr:unnamed protein product [Diatraea saccharalis]
MVIYADIDKVLNFDDFMDFYIYDLKWPWTETHFIINEYCYECGQYVNRSSRIGHFSVIMTRIHVKKILLSSYFWCNYCHYSVYDHYTTDECILCAN